MYAINYLPERDMSRSITGCCPPFEPAEWDGKTFEFKDKKFMKFTTRSIMHVPLNMGTAITKAMQLRDDAGAGDNDEYFMLSDEVSPWKAEHYLSVDKAVPGAEMVNLSGTYMAKVFEGPYKNMRFWYEDLLKYVRDQGAIPIKTYFAYTMCPSCSKAYGKNYVVGFEQIKSDKG